MSLSKDQERAAERLFHLLMAAQPTADEIKHGGSSVSDMSKRFERVAIDSFVIDMNDSLEEHGPKLTRERT